MNLIDEILSEERKVLKKLGYELSKDCADQKYPESYYKDYLYNLFENMLDKHKMEYGGGSGGELNATEKRPAKMASIRSSSAMTFNILGNGDIILKPENKLNHTEGVYYIEYEKQYETIGNGNLKQRANLDAFLVSQDGSEIIFCEMKMLEWLSKNIGELKAAYKDVNSYIHKEHVADFLKAVEIIEQMIPTKCFEYYDVWQMFKHTLAIYNYMQDTGWNKYKKVTLVNVVFEPDLTSLSDKIRESYTYRKNKEHEGFENFKVALVDAGLLKEEKCFDVKYLSAKDFMDCFDIPKKKRRYLKRYTFEG